jgi:hypothetical protein
MNFSALTLAQRIKKWGRARGADWQARAEEEARQAVDAARNAESDGDVEEENDDRVHGDGPFEATGLLGPESQGATETTNRKGKEVEVSGEGGKGGEVEGEGVQLGPDTRNPRQKLGSGSVKVGYLLIGNLAVLITCFLGAGAWVREVCEGQPRLCAGPGDAGVSAVHQRPPWLLVGAVFYTQGAGWEG